MDWNSEKAGREVPVILAREWERLAPGAKSCVRGSREGQGRGVVHEGCRNQGPQPGWFATTEIHSLTMLEAKV